MYLLKGEVVEHHEAVQQRAKNRALSTGWETMNKVYTTVVVCGARKIYPLPSVCLYSRAEGESDGEDIHVLQLFDRILAAL